MAQMDVLFNPPDNYELVEIPAGHFMMGSPEDEKDRDYSEGPQHEVYVSAFFMGRYPVTNAQYELFLKKNPKVPKPEYWADSQFNKPNQPVVGVSWEDAQTYAGWAGLRLPTEAEWEYACRAGTTSRFFSGDTEKDLAAVGWYDGNSKGRLQTVGERTPNGFGLYDMHGNVREWVEDDWHDTYKGAPDDGVAWIGDPRATHRVIRGGSWRYVARRCRSAAREYRSPINRNLIIGFRLAKSVALGS
jgi:formylglycine-generating enzyme required for sulfatase activity